MIIEVNQQQEDSNEKDERYLILIEVRDDHVGDSS